MLALGPFPRFADGTVKNIEKSWLTVLERLSIEDVGGERAKKNIWGGGCTLFFFLGVVDNVAAFCFRFLVVFFGLFYWFFFIAPGFTLFFFNIRSKPVAPVTF